MKVSYVVPRYGPEVSGGAEFAARMWAEHLTERSIEVEVLTSCAVSSVTWADELAPGTEEVNGVRVRRFSCIGRSERFEDFSLRLRDNPAAASVQDSQRWIELQGPSSPQWLAAISESDADVICFYPYLYFPTVRGLPLVADRAVLHPATHDEWPAHLPIFKSVFESAAGLVFHTEAEQHLTNELFSIASHRQSVIPPGIEPLVADPGAAKAEVGLASSDRYVLCLGRIDESKGTTLLVQFFSAYKKRFPESNIKLVLAGPISTTISDAPDVIVAGRVSEETKWGLIAGADVLISPSSWESFSLVLYEAWSQGVPVMVNGVCHATRESVERSGGGLIFHGYAQFEAQLHKLVGDAELRTVLGELGNAYWQKNLTWPDLVDRYLRFLTDVRSFH